MHPSAFAAATMRVNRRRSHPSLPDARAYIQPFDLTCIGCQLADADTSDVIASLLN
jgi:hypothetical protein